MKFQLFSVLRLIFIISFLSVLASVSVMGQCPTNVNLIVNGDAEAQQSITGNTNQDVTGWENETGAFTVVRYGEPVGFPSATDPGPANRGNFFFSGGPSSSLASATQTLDVSGCSAQIDTGNLNYTVSGFFGGRVGQNDRARLDLQFYDDVNIQIGLATIGPVTASDRGNATGLLARALNGSIPTGTRSIQFVIFMIPQAGDNDGYADNLSFIINAPTAANATVSGRVTDQIGRAISSAVVSIVDTTGNTRTARTGSFGYFSFDDVEAGQTYVIYVTHKRHTFSSQVVSVSDSVNDLSFIAN
ncbi:MAG: carboxypeptidase regulatory-like domain-containing protein [Blastocatellia bacterium]|nr:carboxypeptidase regulatory-like domain-containing protein [Blastocatellia bacterium]